MNQTNTVMLAILVALAATTGLLTALSSVATPAHAKVNNCPTGDSCTAGGSGQEGGGAGGHEVFNSNTDTRTISGGQGHLGGVHETGGSGGVTCVGSACP